MAGDVKHTGGTAPRLRWICDRPLLRGDDVRSMLGYGVLLVHLRCYERELGIEKARDVA